jgi:hypothetical protein
MASGDPESLIGSARKACRHDLAHAGTRAVATRDIGRLAGLFAFCRTQLRNDVISSIAEADELGRPLDTRSKRLQPLDQQSFMLVLWKHLDERIGCQILRDGCE